MSGKPSQQYCPTCGLRLELHGMENELYGVPDSIWLYCDQCNTTWEAHFETVDLREII